MLDAATKRLRITDFGIGSVTAKETNRQERTGHSTRGGRLLSYLRGSHTPIYSSPQQRRGDDPDPRDDVHALGVIAYQMLTGKLDSGPGTGATRVLRGMGVADEVADLILRCASEELDDRPVTASAFMSELDHAKSEPIDLLPAPPLPPPPPPIVVAKPVLKAGDRLEIPLPGGLSMAFA